MSLAREIGVTDTTVSLDYGPGRYFTAAPTVLVTVKGAPTDVDWTHTLVNVPRLGEVHSGLVLSFQAAAVGKRATVWVDGVEAPT